MQGGKRESGSLSLDNRGQRSIPIGGIHASCPNLNESNDTGNVVALLFDMLDWILRSCADFVIA